MNHGVMSSLGWRGSRVDVLDRRDGDVLEQFLPKKQQEVGQ